MSARSSYDKPLRSNAATTRSSPLRPPRRGAADRRVVPRPGDTSRVSMETVREVTYWTEKFGIGRDELDNRHPGSRRPCVRS